MNNITLATIFGIAGSGAAAAQMSARPDADMQQVLDALASLGGKPIEGLSPQQARQQPTPADAVKKVLQGKHSNAPPAGDVTIKDIRIPGPIGPIPAHVYTPSGMAPFPVIVYFHGGGFVIADTKTYDASVRALARGAKAVVVSVDYHQAPEHKFPAAPNDAFAAYQWVREHAVELGGDPERIAVAGESAGGNLATVVCLMARDKHQAMPVHQLLVYPVVDNDFSRPSYQQNALAKPLNKAMMQWFFEHYSTAEAANDPYALPMKAESLKGLPPATIIAAEIDPLASEGKAYAERLKRDGVDVTYKEYPGVTHEFFGMGATVAKAKEAEARATQDLSMTLSK